MTPTLADELCNRCHHTYAKHQRLLIGTQCHGYDWEIGRANGPCRCDGFVPKASMSEIHKQQLDLELSQLYLK